MEQQKIIALDMDGVLADNQKHYLSYYYNETGIRLDPLSMLGKSEGLGLPDETAIYRYLHTEGFFRTLPVAEDAIEIVRELQNRYKVYVVSAAMEFPHSLREKFDWLAEYFPFISWKNIVFCGDKSMIKTDYLLDDHISNLRTFQGKPVLFNSFHNVNEQGYERLMNWKEVGEYFLK
ncbi:5' nucleotidase, NT5C type [Sphingobacterium spiritivorum]|uniref:5' nucleotidase, NT5C type n=1 Tax=Sphingobacterium TaxID=28453 RepID=UPI0025ECCD74|nr:MULTISPECIES: 5'(3')-deoxyribonucleotidase [unclassified Sphingobacterium]